MTLNLIDWIAVVLLILGGLKGFFGLVAPSFLKRLSKNVVNSRRLKNVWISVIGVLTIVLLYFALTTVSVSQFVVSGYAFYLLVMVLVFAGGNSYLNLRKEWMKLPNSWWRLVLGVWFVISLVLLYFVLF